jgi:hypothetical protein
MSTTPRTDAAYFEADEIEHATDADVTIAMRDFARELECENARLLAALQRIVALGARMPEDAEEVCIAKAALSPAIPDSKP